MSKAKLKITEFGQEPREVELKSGVTSFGRAPDNAVSFASDSNVSRFHAEIERRGDNFYLVDLNSRNGTFVNDEAINAERRLQNGDQINLGGGEIVIEFRLEDADSAAPENDVAAVRENAPPLEAPEISAPQAEAAAAPKTASSMPLILTIAAVLSGLAVVAVVGTLLFLYLPPTGGGGCGDVEALILSPESGTTVSEETEIKIAAENAKCIERISVRLDGEEIASAAAPPFSVKLEPENFRQFLDDETTHVLSIAVVTHDGKTELQKGEARISFESGKEEPDDTKTPEITENLSNEQQSQTIEEETKQISFAETKEMCERLLKQFSGSFAYKFDRQFLQQVQTKTAEYKSENFSARAAQYRDAINVAFVGEQGVDAPLAYLLAMSRSRFENKKNGAREGLWQMTADFAASNGYDGQCAAETLGDAAQNCAARVAAVYTKALVVSLFEGDVVYGVACFEMSPAEAGNFKISLPADRSDFWNAIKSPKQREQIARFFAAGIVAENPQKFGLKRDRPLSALYQNLLNR